MRRLFSALIFVYVLTICTAAFADPSFYAIYDNKNGFVQIDSNDDDEIRAKISIFPPKSEKNFEGFIDGNKAYLYDEDDNEVTFTFGKIEGNNYTSLRVKGAGKPFDGIYNAYKGHM